MNSRDKILQRLRSVKNPFPSAPDPVSRLEVTPLTGENAKSLTSRFILEAQKLACDVHLAADDLAAVQLILSILEGENSVLTWDFNHIPCPILESALHEAEISVAAYDDATALFGITGAEAALSATGSLVLVSGPGRHRTTSLLPRTHIAVITQDQILPNMESWLVTQRENEHKSFNQAANINIVSGPSRTADIAMELILGMHGPENLHIIIISSGETLVG